VGRVFILHFVPGMKTLPTSWFAVSETMMVRGYQYGYTEALSFNQLFDLYKIHFLGFWISL
jgi:hypothetical protein